MKDKALSEKGQVKFGNTAIDYTVIRSRRRKKTIEITLDHGQGVLVASPVNVSAEKLGEFVLKRAGWIVQRAGEDVLQPRRKEFVSGESLPYLGRQARLFVEHAGVKRPSVSFGHWSFQIVVPAHLEGEARRESIENALVRWYKAQAVERLSERTGHWAAIAGWTPTAIRVRDQRRRWGSCSTDGTLRFNWRIVMAPPNLIDYIVVHELAHLRMMNHSAAFWAVVAKLMPDYGVRRALLKEIGPTLTI